MLRLYASRNASSASPAPAQGRGRANSAALAPVDGRAAAAAPARRPSVSPLRAAARGALAPLRSAGRGAPAEEPDDDELPPLGRTAALRHGAGRSLSRGRAAIAPRGSRRGARLGPAPPAPARDRRPARPPDEVFDYSSLDSDDDPEPADDRVPGYHTSRAQPSSTVARPGAVLYDSQRRRDLATQPSVCVPSRRDWELDDLALQDFDDTAEQPRPPIGDGRPLSLNVPRRGHIDASAFLASPGRHSRSNDRRRPADDLAPRRGRPPSPAAPRSGRITASAALLDDSEPDRSANADTARQPAPAPPPDGAAQLHLFHGRRDHRISASAPIHLQRQPQCSG